MTDVHRGLIIVNTGPGKGKTTAAMGTGLRAVGNGMNGQVNALTTYGGELIAAGSVEDIANCPRSYTGQFLKHVLH